MPVYLTVQLVIPKWNILIDYFSASTSDKGNGCFCQVNWLPLNIFFLMSLPLKEMAQRISIYRQVAGKKGESQSCISWQCTFHTSLITATYSLELLLSQPALQEEGNNLDVNRYCLNTKMKLIKCPRIKSVVLTWVKLTFSEEDKTEPLS